MASTTLLVIWKLTLKCLHVCSSENFNASYSIRRLQGGKWRKEEQKPLSSQLDLLSGCRREVVSIPAHHTPCNLPTHMHARTQTHTHAPSKQAVSHSAQLREVSSRGFIMHSSWVWLLWLWLCVCVGLWLLYLPTAQPSQTWYIARIIYVLWPCWHSTGSYRSKHDFTNLKRSHFCWSEPFTYSEL